MFLDPSFVCLRLRFGLRAIPPIIIKLQVLSSILKICRFELATKRGFAVADTVVVSFADQILGYPSPECEVSRLNRHGSAEASFDVPLLSGCDRKDERVLGLRRVTDLENG